MGVQEDLEVRDLEEDLVVVLEALGLVEVQDEWPVEGVGLGQPSDGQEVAPQDALLEVLGQVDAPYGSLEESVLDELLEEALEGVEAQEEALMGDQDGASEQVGFPWPGVQELQQGVLEELTGVHWFGWPHQAEALRWWSEPGWWHVGAGLPGLGAGQPWGHEVQVGALPWEAGSSQVVAQLVEEGTVW